MACFRAVGLNLGRDAAKLIILRYDDDRDGFLTFSNVRNIFQPRDVHLSHEFKSRLPDSRKKGVKDIDYKTMSYIRTLILKIIEVERSIELFKREIQKRPQFNLAEAFEVVMRINPSNNEDCITPDEF